MNISARVNYGCLAMLELGSQYEAQRPVPIREIAARHSAPQQFLVQILLQLKRAGLINSTRGAFGGYNLVRPPEEITIGEVISAIDGHSEEEPEAEKTNGSAAARVLGHTWRRVDAAERAMLAEISLSDLIGEADEIEEQMYYI